MRWKRQVEIEEIQNKLNQLKVIEVLLKDFNFNEAICMSSKERNRKIDDINIKENIANESDLIDNLDKSILKSKILEFLMSTEKNYKNFHDVHVNSQEQNKINCIKGNISVCSTVCSLSICKKIDDNNSVNIPKVPILSVGIPKITSLSKDSNNSKIPNMPVIPNIPNISSVPVIPNIPIIPNIPGIPNIPNIPNILNVTGISNISNIPGIPNIPNIPNIPKIPNASGIINIPTIPGIPKIPTIPNIPGIPGIPNISMGFQQQSKKVEFKPPSDMITKRLNWTGLHKTRIQDSFWISKIKELAKDTSNINNKEENPLTKKIDEELLLELFAESKSKKKDSNDDINQPEKEGKKEVKALEDKRIMNLSIALAKVTISNDDLKKSIFELNKNNSLNIEDIEKIIPMLPTKEDKEQLDKFTGDKEKLSSVEKFVMILLAIPKHKEALEFIKYSYSIEEECLEIKNKLEIFLKCIEDINLSDLFKNLLLMILTIGNYLNFGSRYGSFTSISLSSLNQLETVKAFTNNQFTLLDYLIKNIKIKDPKLITFYKDFDLSKALEVSYYYHG